MTPGFEVRGYGAGVRMSFVQKKSGEIEEGQRREQNLELHGRRGRTGWGLVRYHLGGSGGEEEEEWDVPKKEFFHPSSLEP